MSYQKRFRQKEMYEYSSWHDNEPNSSILKCVTNNIASNHVSDCGKYRSFLNYLKIACKTYLPKSVNILSTHKVEKMMDYCYSTSKGLDCNNKLLTTIGSGRTTTTNKILRLALIIVILPVFTTVAARNEGGYDEEVVVSGYSEVAAAPYFLSPGNRNITTTQGQTAYLNCRVASLGDKAQVSWIRKRDLHVLSSSRVVFATDQRFQVLNSDEKSENWTLQIKFSQKRDSGVYECQVNTVPKIYMAYQLNVVESEAVIQGPLYVKAGSTINLTCSISDPDMQGLVFWYYGDLMLKYEEEERVNIYTTRDFRGHITSQLTIRRAKLSNSGNYTCFPTVAKPKIVIVNVVLQGEHPAAMQTGHAPPQEANNVILISSLSAITFLTIMSDFSPWHTAGKYGDR